MIRSTLVVDSEAFLWFFKFFWVRVKVLGPNSSNWLWIHTVLDLWWFLVKWDRAWVLPESCLGIWTVSFDPWFWIFAGKAISLFSSSGSNRWKPSLLLLFLLLWSACDHARSALLPVACSRRIAGSQLSDEGSCESLRVAWICVDSNSIWCWWSNSMANLLFLVWNWSELVLNSS